MIKTSDIKSIKEKAEKREKKNLWRTYRWCTRPWYLERELKKEIRKSSSNKYTIYYSINFNRLDSYFTETELKKPFNKYLNNKWSIKLKTHTNCVHSWLTIDFINDGRSNFTVDRERYC